MDPREPQRGTVIAGKYRIERTLGEGGMGVVVEATHQQLGHRVAVKLLRSDQSLMADGIARFQREARIAAQLTSEHITRVTDMGQTTEGELYLVMELLQGGDLQTELLRRGPLPIDEAVGYVLQAAEALAEAHAAGLVHRDVKPANLFLAQRHLGRPPIVKLLDFGLSKAPGRNGLELTKTASSFGTPQYMSPEQLRSTKHVDARTDQHGLALVLYELLAGCPAYEAMTPTALAVSIAMNPPPHVRDKRNDVPEEIDAAIVRALAKDPVDRFPDLSGFAQVLAPFGGPAAADLVEAITTALSSTRRVAGAHGTAPITMPPGPMSDTAPFGVALVGGAESDAPTPHPPSDAGKKPFVAADDVSPHSDTHPGTDVDAMDSEDAMTSLIAPVPKVGDSVPPGDDDATMKFEPRAALAAHGGGALAPGWSPRAGAVDQRTAAPMLANAGDVYSVPGAMPPVVSMALRPATVRRGALPSKEMLVLVGTLFFGALVLGVLATLWFIGRGPFGP